MGLEAEFDEQVGNLCVGEFKGVFWGLFEAPQFNLVLESTGRRFGRCRGWVDIVGKVLAILRQHLIKATSRQFIRVTLNTFPHRSGLANSVVEIFFRVGIWVTLSFINRALATIFIHTATVLAYSTTPARETNTASFVVLAERSCVAATTLVRLSTVDAFVSLSLLLTGFTALAAKPVPIEVIIVSDATTSAFTTNKEVTALRVVRCHLLILADEC